MMTETKNKAYCLFNPYKKTNTQAEILNNKETSTQAILIFSLFENYLEVCIKVVMFRRNLLL